jgi:hypothetical protein
LGIFHMRLKLTLALAAASAGLLASTPASAALTLITNCNAAPSDVLGGYTQTCSGYYAGQLLSGNASDVADQQTALAGLGFNTAGFNFNSYLKLSGLAGNSTINWGVPLSGVTYFAIHYGGGTPSPTPGQDSTAFYRVDFGATPINSFQLNFGSTSDAVLYSTVAAIPEPATWGMMLLGFGIIGGSLRRRRTLALA